MTVMIDLTREGSGEPELALLCSLAGFPGVRRFRRLPLRSGEGPFSLLVALDVEGLWFVVVDPLVLWPDYGESVARAGIDDWGFDTTVRLEFRCFVTPGAGDQGATVNLYGPLVIRSDTGEAIQVSLPTSGYGIAVPIEFSA